MKKILLSLSTCLFLLNLTFAQTIKGNGEIVMQDRTIQPFTSLKTSHGWDLELTQGNSYELTIETDENLVDYVKTEMNGDMLRIYSDVNIMKSTKRVIHITFKSLKSLDASGGADIKADGRIRVDDFNIQCSGGSDLYFREIECTSFSGNFSGGSDATIGFASADKIDIDARGGSDIRLKDIAGEDLKMVLQGGSDATLNGYVAALNISGSGGSDVSALDLDVEDAKIELSGASDGKFTIKNKLDLYLSGGSDFYCKGDPDIVHQNVCKSCGVRM